MNVLFKRGTTAQNTAYVGAAGSLTIDIEKMQLHLHDGTTPGGTVITSDTSIADVIEQLNSLGIQDINGLEAALSDKLGTDALGAPNGVATLDANGQVSTSQLPSFVEEVLEYDTREDFPETGVKSRIYVAVDSGAIYRWGGSAYIEISPAPGSTDEVAEGDTNLYFTASRARQAISATGAASYDASTGEISVEEVTKSSIGLGNVANYAMANQEQAEAASSNSHYMSPLATGQLLQSIGFTQADGKWSLDLGTFD